MDKNPKLRFISIDKLELWEEANVRKNDALENITDLATSIRKNGVRVPLLVKPEGRFYKVFSGQRRLEASRIAKLEEIPCYVFVEISLKSAMMLSLTENVLREAMTKEDKSVAAAELLRLCKGIDKVAKIMGVAESTVRGYLRYDDIPQELRDYKNKGALPSEIEKTFVKFPNIEDAKAVLDELIKIRDRKKRQAYRVALRKSLPSDKPSDIKKKATAIEHSKPLEIILDDDYYSTLSKVAFVRKRSDQEFAQEIVEDWIDGYHRGEHRD